MCNELDLSRREGSWGGSPADSLSQKGVLVIAASHSVAGAVVSKLAGEGAHVLVATEDASELSHSLSGARGSLGRVQGMTVDVSRKTELERVFRWVDGTLLHLDALVGVVEEESQDRPDGDLEAWHTLLEERWVMPLLLVEGAAMRMRPRRQGHILQVALHSQTRIGGGVESSVGERGRAELEPVWRTLREMLEARREGLRSDGIRLTILEVEGLPSGAACGRSAAAAWTKTEAEPCPSPGDVAEAVRFCLHRRQGAVVEALRLRAPCGGGEGVCNLNLGTVGAEGRAP
jgi:NAD(P)-dependent dehydrogenase (short-subunit alcohol dehydrogenase family)